MKMRKIFVAFMALTLMLTGVLGNSYLAKAEDGTSIVFSDKNFNLVVKPGDTTHIKLPIKAAGSNIVDAKANIIDKSSESPFVFTDPEIKMSTYTANTTTISTFETTFIEFDVTTNETTGIKSYPVTLEVNGMYSSLSGETISGTFTLDFKLQVLEEKAPAQLAISEVASYNAAAGKNMDLIFKVKNEGEITARSTYISVNYGETGISKRYSAENIKVGNIAPGMEQEVNLPLKVLSTATAGKKNLTINFKYKDMDGKESTASATVSVEIKENKDAPNLEIQDIDYSKSIKPGDEFVLTATMRNFGVTTAKDIKVSVVSENADTDSFFKNYYTDTIEVKDIKGNAKQNVEIPLIVSHSVATASNKLKVNITYTDALGVSYTETKTLYIEVAVSSEQSSNNVVISKVKQVPAQPVAGERVDISFDFENKGTADISEIKIWTAASGTSFIPVQSEPYQYYEKLKAGKKIRVKMPLIVSKSAPEGLNNLTVNYTIAGGEEKPVTIPVHDIQNDLGSSSIPKLIISNYETDTEELKAGSTFNFTFDIYNSHSSVSAKNITVTVTQAENIFSVTQGSNSFFINKVKPGESVEETLELRVKSDAKTNAYKLNIKIEYEYDGIEPNPETGKIGETKEYDLNLQAVENARPVVDYVNVSSWDGNLVMGSPATLYFEFYNMGKSPLNNVIATVEGDFTKTDGNMMFVGNVAEGSSEPVEFEVTPNVEGTAKGILKITFEDSNGDEVEYTKEFEQEVMGAAQVFNPDMPGGDMGPMKPDLPMTKKPIMPILLFIIIEVVIFVAFIPITRNIIIRIYRKKLQKREEAGL